MILTVLNKCKSRSAEKLILLSLREIFLFGCRVMTMNVADFHVGGRKSCEKMMVGVEASMTISLQSNITADICTKPQFIS